MESQPQREYETGSWRGNAVAGELAGFGDQLEAMDPAAVRRELAGIGARLARLYGR